MVGESIHHGAGASDFVLVSDTADKAYVDSGTHSRQVHQVSIRVQEGEW